MKNIKSTIFTLRLFTAFLLILVSKNSKAIGLGLLSSITYIYFDTFSDILLSMVYSILGYIPSLLLSYGIALLLSYPYAFSMLKTWIEDEEFVRKPDAVKNQNSKNLKARLLKALIDEMINENNKSENQDSHHVWKYSDFDYLLLSSDDRKLITSFFKAMLKAGRNILAEKAFEFDPRKLFYKESGTNIIKADRERMAEEIRNNEHLTALARLHSSHARGDSIAIWKESREIVEHFYSHICQKMDNRDRYTN